MLDIFSCGQITGRLKAMGKDLQGNELGKGISQRKDGLYVGRATIDGAVIAPVYDKDLGALKKKFNSAKNMARVKALSEIKLEVPTLNEWFAKWFEFYKKPTLDRNNPDAYTRSVRNYILCKIGTKRLDEILQIDIQICVKETLDRGIQPKSIREAVGVLQQSLDAAIANRLIVTNPSLGVIVTGTSQVKRRVLSNEEQKRFIDYLERNNHWFTELYKILLLSGLRISEAAGLKWSDIDFDNKFIHVREQLPCDYDGGKKFQEFTTPKTENSVRDIPFFGETEKLFIAQRQKIQQRKAAKGRVWKTKKQFSDLVFFTSLGTPISRHSIESSLKSIVDMMNKIEIIESKNEGRTPFIMENINPHATRHTFCTRCFEKGMNPRIIQEIMGHVNFNTTISYAHVLTDRMQQEAQMVGNFFEETVICTYNENEYEYVMGVI